MDKKIEDYLHLYLGATIKYVNYFGFEPNIGVMNGIHENHAWCEGDDNGIPFPDIQLVLQE